jgi:1-deoxy-D-xylulose-5-phosphate synthase
LNRKNQTTDILSRIAGPEDLKELSIQELSDLSGEIREFLINTVSNTGGHIASNLGVVELTLALHRIYDIPRDKIIWDVGHQTYVHKILTGRKNRFDTLRQMNGLSGFPKTEESIFDAFNTGHSSTSISAALGMARARDLKGETYSVAAVIGDGALTGGMALEALNDAGNAKTNLLIVLNDNGMSIAPNVGGLSRYLSRLRMRPFYYKTRESIQSLIDRRLPRSGKHVRRILHRIKAAMKSILMPSMFFEDLGFRYFGPIDGHNLREMISVLEHARTMKGPVLVHVCTLKGKGYKYAEEKPNVFHGIAPFQIETGELKSNGGESYSQVFGRKICELAQKSPDIVAITAAMPDGTGLNPFREAFPKRFFDVGIAEQHAVTFAAGLAKGGTIPVVAIYSTFLQRAYDQMLHDVALQNLHVVFAIDRAGVVGDDGETHQGIYDIAYIKTMPNFTLMAPASPRELEMMLEYAVLDHRGPIAIRYPRGSGYETEALQQPVIPGKGLKIKSGEDVTIVAVGNFLKAALKTADLLEAEGISCEVINPRFIKPIDEPLLRESIRRTGRIVVMEDGITSGGLGSSILEFLCRERMPAKSLLLGFPDEAIAHGSRDLIYKKYGLDPQSISDRILDFIGTSNQKGGRAWEKNASM